MAVFDMIEGPTDEKLITDAFVINDHYFTIDTAERATIDEWLAHNRHICTYAMHKNAVHGFYNIMPLTAEAGKLFADNNIKEEDLRASHIMPHEFLHRAESAYFAGIAVKDREAYISKQCVAALLSVIASHMLNGYKQGVFTRLYANPTTFYGNHMVRRLGMKPLVSFKKPLKGNDLYVSEMTIETRAVLKEMQQRYARFVANDPWAA